MLPDSGRYNELSMDKSLGKSASSWSLAKGTSTSLCFTEFDEQSSISSPLTGLPIGTPIPYISRLHHVVLTETKISEIYRTTRTNRQDLELPKVLKICVLTSNEVGADQRVCVNAHHDRYTK